MQLHRLGGRAFHAIGESNMAHDLRTMALLREVGIDRVGRGPEETDEGYATRVLLDVVGSGKALDLLGCLLIPEGTDSRAWTPRLGDDTAAHLAGVSDPREKLQIQALILSALVDFFQLGLASSPIFATSSGRPEPDDAESEAESPTGASVNGGPSSGPSPGSTTTEPGGSSGGRSGKSSSATANGSAPRRPGATATKFWFGRFFRRT